MTENILDIRRLAEMPKTVGGQQLFIFVPLANAYEPGIASFSSQDFTVTGRSAMVTINTNKFVTLTKLTEELAKKVDKTTKINNKSLDKDIVIYASDVPMAANDSTSVLAKFGLVDAKIAKLEQDTTAVYRYRGSVNTYADLLSIWDSKIGTGSQKPRVGDTYDVKSLNMNYAFVDEVSATAPNGWDALGQLFVLTPATPNKIGGVKPDDMTIGVKEDGTIFAKPATNDKPGIVQPDGETVFVKNGKLSTSPNTDDRAYIQSLFDLYFKSVDYVFAGINPELELLENPVQVVLGSDGMGYVNLDYPLDLVEGKNYHIKATIGKLDGSVEEYERDIAAQRNDIDQPICLLDYSDQKIIYVVDKVKSTPTGGTEADENASTVMAGDEGDTKVWSYVTFTSIVQKEKTSSNLLKEPLSSIVGAENSVPVGYKLGLEAGKAYDIEFSIDGVIRTVTSVAINMVDIGEEIPANALMAAVVQDTTKSEREATKGEFYVYDGVNTEMTAAEDAQYVFTCQDSNGNEVTAQVLSIKENIAVQEFVTPLELNFDNSTTIQIPGGDMCNGFIYKKSEFLKSIKDDNVIELVMDISIGDEVQTDVKYSSLAYVDSSNGALEFTVDVGNKTLYFMDSNQLPSDYICVVIELGTSNYICKIKSIALSSIYPVELTKANYIVNKDKLGLIVGQQYDWRLKATNDTGNIASYSGTSIAEKKTISDGVEAVSLIIQDNPSEFGTINVYDGVRADGGGNAVVADNSVFSWPEQKDAIASISVLYILPYYK